MDVGHVGTDEDDGKESENTKYERVSGVSLVRCRVI